LLRVPPVANENRASLERIKARLERFAKCPELFMRIDPQLAHLEETKLVRRLVEPDLAYLFTHNLIQDTVYDSLLRNERKRLHQLVGTAMEESYAPRLDEFCAVLSQHFEEAGDDRKTLVYAVRAGDAAARVNAGAEAIEFYTRALDAARRLGPTADLPPGVALVDVYLKRGRMLEVRGEFVRALENYAELAREGEARGDLTWKLASVVARATIHAIPSAHYDETKADALTTEGLALARQLNDPAAEAKILWILMLRYSRAGWEYSKAVKYGEEALALARKHGLREREAYALNDLSTVLVFLGERERGLHYNLEARALWIEFDNLPMLSDNFNYAAMNFMFGGEYDAALDASAEGRRISREIGNPWGEAFSWTWIGEVYRDRGEITRALQVMQEAMSHGDVFPPNLILAQIDMARLYGDLGDLERGMTLALRADEQAERRFLPMRVFTQGGLAYIHLLRGEVARAESIALQTPALDAPHGNLRYSLDGYVPLIEVYLQRDEFDRAAELGTRLIAAQRTRSITQYLPTSLHQHARALMGLGELDGAASALAEARALCEANTLRWIWWRIEATATELAARRGDAAGAEQHRGHARALLEYIVARVPAELQASFTSRPDVQSVLNG
jgi:tetratricopeptide (TPR) repeat protein